MSQKVQNVNFLKVHNFNNIIDKSVIFFPVGSPSIGCITVPNMKALSLIMLTGEPNKEIY